jgi:hypothetical protein
MKKPANQYMSNFVREVVVWLDCSARVSDIRRNAWERMGGGGGGGHEQRGQSLFCQV